MYICNIMTQPGETDDYTVSDHVKTLNKYLGEKKVGVVLVNNGIISKEIREKYATLEQKILSFMIKKNAKKFLLEL